MQNPLIEVVSKRRRGIHCGIPSFCCANKIAIEAVLEQALRFGDRPLIEATSNQVNQDGGYMNMTPMDFSNYVHCIADKLGILGDNIILGGDHMGPQPWANLPAAEAMEKAKVLVTQCVQAGYKKIHLDTSMRLGDDSRTEPLSDEVVAERGAVLYKVCEDAFQEMLKTDPTLMHPVFVIGSEVPIPGGIQDEEESCSVTRPASFEHTLDAYTRKFHELGLDSAWDHIIAVVVQPGVEFGNETIRHYNRNAAQELCDALKKHPNIVFEGHSTDYQSPKSLREMVEDGIAIIKVGPALTFALREALFSLSMMEDELISDPEKRSHFREVLDSEMLLNPKDWEKYYFGSDTEKTLARKYSFSDRSRYYMSRPNVEAAIERLLDNMDSVNIPLGMLHQYMPMQYIKVRDGVLPKKARDLVKYNIVTLVEDYNYAVKYNYVISGIFA